MRNYAYICMYYMCIYTYIRVYYMHIYVCVFYALYSGCEVSGWLKVKEDTFITPVNL